MKILFLHGYGCPETPIVTDEPNKADDGTTVQRETYGLGKDGAEVVLVADNLLREFFQRHPMK